MPDFSVEDKYTNPDSYVVGIDEVGRGPWAGPVVASAVIIPNDAKALPFVQDINDSKKISIKKRNELFLHIKETCHIGIGIVEPKIIDQINILQASFKAMDEALTQLTKDHPLYKEKIYTLVDGNKKPDFNACNSNRVFPIIKGDSISTSIAAASIIAKVTRDKIMSDLHETYPYYGWDTNSGYGTKAHIYGIEEKGITEHHRKSFAPIKKHLEKTS